MSISSFCTLGDRLSSGITLLAKHAHTFGSRGPPHRESLIVGVERRMGDGASP